MIKRGWIWVGVRRDGGLKSLVDTERVRMLVNKRFQL